MTKRGCLLVVLLAVLVSEAALAQRRPPIHWLSGGDSIVVYPGETFEYEASFFSDIRIASACWWFSPSMDELLETAEKPNRILGEIVTDRIYRIRFRFHIPSTLPPRQYRGSMFIYHFPGDPGLHKLPDILSVNIYVMEPVQ